MIIGGGISGLTLALSLHRAGIPARAFEAAPVWKRLGVGINLLPHCVREPAQLGLQPALAARAVGTREMSFYNRFGQHIFTEPRGRFAGYDWPQFSIHRGDLHQVLLDAVRERLGRDAVVLDHRCVKVDQDVDGATVHFANTTSRARGTVRGAAHPMYPRGGNGAGQAILDPVAPARCLAAHDDAVAALMPYEAERLNAANAVVLKSRTAPPDSILKVVHERSGGQPFANIEDLIGTAELAAITDDYKRVGFDRASLGAKA